VPRALTLHRTIVTPADRERFLARARELQSYYQSHACRYWVFEEADLGGAFIEFAEAPDVAALVAAHAANPDSFPDPARIYREVAL
jgi:hypothetical protein